jgi:hypothetical protein
MRLNLASGRHTKAEDEDDRGMRVILLSTDTSGAAHKVHSDVRVDLPSAGDTRADNTDHRRMCVDPPSTADSGAARKVHRRMRVDLRGTGETGAEDRDHRRMCVDRPPTTGGAGSESDAGARAVGDGRCYGRFRDLCDCTGDLRFNFSNGLVPHRPSGGDGGLRAPGCHQVESG